MDEIENKESIDTGWFKKKYTLSKIYYCTIEYMAMFYM
jgi:hypothetical protein